MKKIFSLLLALLMVLSCAVMPVMASTDIAAEDLINLYDFYQSNGDMVGEDGTVTADATISSNSMIPVTGGSELYFGPCTEGTVNLATYDENGDFTVCIPVGDCVVTDTLSDGTVIYRYTLASDAAYIWIAAENAYADGFMLTEDQPIDGTLIEAYHAINPLEGKKALFIGDSITHGVKDTPSDHYGWAGRIGTANNMYWVNNGQSGYSVSTCRVGRADYNTIVSKLEETKYESFDYVMLHGGVNDVMDGVAIGEITEGYDPAEFDVDTFAGGLEDLIYKTYYYYGKKATIGYIVNFDLPAHKCGPSMRTYFDVAKEICEKWNVRYFDMLENTKVNSDLKVTAKTYLPDTLHPNKAGYDILAPMIEGFMKTLTKTSMPGSDITDDGNVYNVTFKDDDGTVLSTTTATRVGGLTEDAPSAPAKGTDGIVSNFFEGWTVNGELIDAPDAYDITSDITFTAQYAGKGYGARFEDSEPIVIGDGSAPQELLPETVKLHPESTGITLIYKVDGVDSMIIADDWYIYTNNSGAKKPAAQWGDSTYSLDGLSANHLDLNNGYYYVYINQNLNGTNAKTPEILNSFSIFNPHTDRYDEATARDPKNANTGATFQMLAVTCDNLQPTVTFHGADGDVIGTYTYKYTDIHKNLGFGTADRKYSCQKGQLMGADDIFALTGYTAPEAAEGSILLGWTEDPNADEVVLAKAVYYNCDLYPVFKTFTEDDYESVTFVDAYGELLHTGSVLFGKLVDTDYPVSTDKAPDGVYLYKFRGWTVDGESIIDPAKYEYEGGETVKPLYTTYGVVYENPTAQSIPTDTSKEVNFMTEKVTVSVDASGITWVYKVDGVEEAIIADNFIVATRNGAAPAWQFDDANYCATGDGTANMMSFTNGYFFVYVNDNVNGMNGQKADNVINKFAIYAPTNANYAAGGRTPVNNNENATFTMLAVLNDNLQPTATFHNEDGSELISYTHKYTDIHKNLGFGTGAGQNSSTVKGSLLSIGEAFTLTALETPVKAPTHNGKVTYAFDGWVDADGNAVEALYYNVDLYPSFKIVSDTRETYTVKFVDEDGSELYSTTILEGETPVYEGNEPTKAADKKNTYAFDGWDAEIVPAAGNVTYKATYKATEILYTVTFMNGEIEVAKKTTTYEGAVKAPNDPAKDKTAQYTFTFDKWVDAEGNAVDLKKITDNITVYAKYTETVNQYTVTFMSEDKTEISKSTVDYGTAAEKPADPTKEPSDACTYEFAGWADADGNAVDVDKVVADVTVYPSFKEIPNEVTVTFMNGEERYGSFVFDYGKDGKAPEKAPAFNGEAKPFTKYTFDKWVDAEGNEADLTSLTEDITVYASYKEECEHSFDDIKEGEWYVEAVEWALMNGVMNGEGAKFNPNKATSRGMIVTVLYRIEGSPDVSEVEHPFTDIEEGDWYYDAVKWAYSEGVVNGMSATTYAPDATLTREQFATILYRYAKELKGEDVSIDEGANLDAYTDKDEVSGYALDAVLWTNVNGYIGGTSATKLSPKGSATRAQMATILYRYINK